MPDSHHDHDLLVRTPEGLFCPAGGFHVDPWRPVERAIITHGHADHARRGSRRVLTASEGVGILERRIGGDGTDIEGIDRGEIRRIGDALVSLHPAGHVLGSSQVRIEVKGRIWVFSGDYARLPNPTCRPFEPVRCHRFISECTFGLPLYRWTDPEVIARRLRDLVSEQVEAGRNVVIGAYGLGKAQRLLAALAPDGDSPHPILCHGAVEKMNEAYREAGVILPQTRPANRTELKALDRPAVVLAPPSALSGPWLRPFQPAITVVASGWTMLRGPRRRNPADETLVLSDHVDWPGLLATVEETGCEEVGLTHGFVEAGARWFAEHGLRSVIYDTRYTGDAGDEEPASAGSVSDS